MYKFYTLFIPFKGYVSKDIRLLVLKLQYNISIVSKLLTFKIEIFILSIISVYFMLASCY